MTCSVSRRSRGFGIIIIANECKNGSTSPMDLSTATNISVSFKKGATVLTETVPLLNDGLDGAVVFVTPINVEYFDGVGAWKVEITATFADGVYPSEPTSITVSA